MANNTTYKWLLNETLPNQVLVSTDINFISNDVDFHSIVVSKVLNIFNLIYRVDYSSYSIAWSSDIGWRDESYRTIEFLEEPTGNLLTWLQENGTYQEPEETEPKLIDINALAHFKEKYDEQVNDKIQAVSTIEIIDWSIGE